MRAALVFIACALAMVAHAPSFAQTDASKPFEIKLLYCREGTSDSPWSDNGVRAIARTIARIDKPIQVLLKREPCGPLVPDSTCFAGPGGLACRSEGVERTLRASAFLLAAWLSEGATEYEPFHQANDRAVVNAFRAADGAEPPPEVRDLVEEIRLADAGTGTDELSDEAAALRDTYEYVADRALAIMIGHEISHVFGDACPLSEKSRVEQVGIWRSVYEDHAGAGLFCAQPLIVGELRADQCALRFLHAMAVPKGDGNTPRVHTLDRLAGDLAAYLGYFGFRTQPSTGPISALRLSGYLHAPYRSLLFAAEMADDDAKPAVCGTAARLFVQGVQATVGSCVGKGIVSDALLDLLPDGVEASWNGEQWTDRSWSCEP